MVTDMLCNTDTLEEVVGPLPYSVEDGVRETVRWLRSDAAGTRAASRAAAGA
jgi:hypothetical protein